MKILPKDGAVSSSVKFLWNHNFKFFKLTFLELYYPIANKIPIFIARTWIYPR